MHTELEKRLAGLDPQLELIAVERPAKATLRLYVDHPEGVDLARCEQVTRHLNGLRENWALEVSSPGIDRPLTRPEHFRRFLGRMARVRTREPIDGQKSFTGRLTDVDESRVSMKAPEGEVTIPFERIRRSNLVPEPNGGSA